VPSKKDISEADYKVIKAAVIVSMFDDSIMVEAIFDRYKEKKRIRQKFDNQIERINREIDDDRTEVKRLKNEIKKLRLDKREELLKVDQKYERKGD